jgi:nitroimidazol reductase NimA-like FMN-containing flavoprotein (pyridoxamine 5'-phosphate oxidase superfamily)
MPVEKMTRKEIDQFLTCTRVGRLGVSLEGGPYIVPVGYGYFKGKLFFHTCNKGLKMDGIRRNPNVCFEVDEALSDASMFKSVIAFGKAQIIDDKEKMLPYLQKLINKYRVPESFDKYMSKPGRNREKELEAVRICIITPKKITGRKLTTKDKAI